jgi:hypothetical protein
MMASLDDALYLYNHPDLGNIWRFGLRSLSAYLFVA